MNNTIYFQSHFFRVGWEWKKKVKCYFIFLTRFLLNLSFSPFNDSPFYYFHDNIFSNGHNAALFLLCFIYHTIAIKQRGFLAGLVSLKGKAREEERFKTEGRRKINRKKTFRASACNDLNYKCFSALMLSTSSKKIHQKPRKTAFRESFFYILPANKRFFFDITKKCKEEWSLKKNGSRKW